MLRRLLLPLTIGIALACAAAGFAGNTKSAGLVGEVGPGFTIEVKQGGKDLKTIKAGTYTIKVDDKSSIHDFHLTGKGLNKATSVSGTGVKTWTITLKPGKVTYLCDAHATSMKGSFTVTK